MRKKVKIGIKSKKMVLSMAFLAISAFSFADGENYHDYKALLIGDVNGNIIKEDNSLAVRPLASVTKIMTSILTLDKIKTGQISYDDKVTISSKAASVPYGVKLTAGKQYTVRDLLKATIIKSSNNAAYALAEYVGGDVPSFVHSMNEKAKSYGLDSLRYCSPNGLPPSYTGSCMDQGNARDLYKLAQITLKDYSEYLNFSKNKVEYIDNGNTKVTSTNTLLGNVQGVDGLKTGYHDAAGSNIVLTASRGDDRMIAVILGSNHAKDRNAIGAREINDYYINGYAKKNGGNSYAYAGDNSNKNRRNYNNNQNSNRNSNNNGNEFNNNNAENNNAQKGNKIEQFFNSIFGKNNNNNSAKKMKIISKNDIVAVAEIGEKKYNLYPTKDVEITATQRPNLTYTVNLNSGVNKNSRGKIVGTYIATDGTLTYSGELIMK
ncbi:D-alanyl-D-alanine carboxypeptidase family protein [Leptotrichia wadei]|uniref:Serine-type D-Ala-D-Ala carboxypeptidase n=1 Tax=Leptotrichia wadei TaxID=157687 RepID=A0A510KBU4_9FUSO|nr:D-alanyl-D-alanine carboxypeptidase family protein [Leptotrichia wadei]BBM42162.1 serine-type D-Ala-D-Ala carboxypeptidase [Leptotrichia wadei]BBM46908.1 serine-type D-Ala-D-Ala carboxypeptidase [Leptotrichia wadei]BBM49130.1 serine-type D-Ala-D-Ala carboxypeptidase [Leptotrichia wadei]